MASGGYRKGSGRSKSGYYQGIYCGSTYELCWVIYALDTGIKFNRFNGIITDGITTYIPDFILDDGKSIIELKGYENQETVSKKTALAEKFGYNVEVFRKNDLTDIFSYVYKKFNTKKYYTLYDGYKPKFTYKCKQCKIKVERDKQSKSSIVLCSRTCSMKHNRLVKISTTTPNEKAKSFYYKNRDKILARRRELYSSNMARSSSG